VVVEKVRTEPTLYIFGEKETKEDILRIFVWETWITVNTFRKVQVLWFECVQPNFIGWKLNPQIYANGIWKYKLW
jgi:hypothetical protein